MTTDKPPRNADLALKSNLVEEIKRDEWRKNIDEAEYKTNSNIIHELHKRNLETISKQNKSFKHRNVSVSPSKMSNRITVQARQAYEKWKQQNTRKRKCPEVSVQNLLLLLHYLSSEPDKSSKKEVHECLKTQNSEFETFWDSPSFILKCLRKCVLTRDWQNMVYFSLLLLNYDKKYLQIVRNMCQIMVKFYPLLEESGLEDQFKALIQPPTQEKLTIV